MADLATAVAIHSGVMLSARAFIESMMVVPADQIHVLANDNRIQQVKFDAPAHGRGELYTATLSSDILMTDGEPPHQRCIWQIIQV